MAVWPWYGGLAKGLLYGGGEFLAVQDYKNVNRWADQIGARPAVKRGRMVNRLQGDPAQQLHERHDASDFETEDAGQARHPGLTRRRSTGPEAGAAGLGTATCDTVARRRPERARMDEHRKDLTTTTLGVMSVGGLIIGSVWILQPFIPAIIWAITLGARDMAGDAGGTALHRRQPGRRRDHHDAWPADPAGGAVVAGHREDRRERGPDRRLCSRGTVVPVAAAAGIGWRACR